MSREIDTTPSEREILEGLLGGDDRCAGIVVRRHAGRLLAVARRYPRQEEDAQDAVQEAFAQGFQRIGTFRGEAGLGTWLHRIVVNRCLKKLRERGRSAEESIEPLMPRFDKAGCRIEPLASSIPSPEAVVDRRETREVVRRAVDDLPENYRTVLLLRDIEGYSTREAAELLEITEGALKVRLHRARAALRQRLEPMFGGEAT